ncbi:hypothetical protein BKA70DRAFT_1121209 [Coprinopsis sp. MPI-PUGE-AT-0042]|nr:hypothetical protein BKA70DRAFT_1121209 [Coprinopsis sp. MPI-PUGE-AT-0042]
MLVLNNGSKFLYQNQMASLLDDIRTHRVPPGPLMTVPDLASGCVVVKLLDYRATRSKHLEQEKQDRTRVIPYPNPEPLYAGVCALNARSKSNWTDCDALDTDSKLLLANAPPLYLIPVLHLTRIARHVLRAPSPTVPMSLNRNAYAHEPKEGEAGKTRLHRSPKH